MCRLVKISRAAYYKWLNHEPSKRQNDDDQIVTYMIQLEKKHSYIYGVERLKMYVNMETSFHACSSHIRRLMHENNIKASIRVFKHDRKAERKEIIFGNKLLDEKMNHTFQQTKANTVWVTDCSELRFGPDFKYKLRLSAIKDLYDHSIIAWSVAPTETAKLVTDTLESALTEHASDRPAIIHSDQGSAYTSKVYNQVLLGAGIAHSMSRPGTPGDNSPMESFWSHMKDEFFAFHQAYSEEEMIQLIESSIDWYNSERRQKSLNGMTPNEYRNHAVKQRA